MALIKCKECGKEISRSAKTCPNCGYKPRRTSFLTWLVTIFIAVPIVIAVFAGSSTTMTPTTKPAENAEDRAARVKADAAVQRASVGAKLLKKAMRNPESFKLESALVIESTGAACYEYRAQNGSGGMNTGQAVLSGDAKLFKTDEMDGFARLWNEECAGKVGTDATTAINWFAL
ncbi:MAG: zinc ribbon domain-containing protein [Rhodospirillales bacterium]|nr:zinc ribbon domain-containing protein [Rhodospirillales bacterium]